MKDGTDPDAASFLEWITPGTFHICVSPAGARTLNRRIKIANVPIWIGQKIQNLQNANRKKIFGRKYQKSPFCSQFDGYESFVRFIWGRLQSWFAGSRLVTRLTLDQLEEEHVIFYSPSTLGSSINSPPECQVTEYCVTGCTFYSDVNNLFTCSCPNCKDGDRCEQDVNLCANLPGCESCEMNDICTDVTCACSSCWFGHKCDIPVDFCQGFNCLNGGVCKQSEDCMSRFCECPDNYRAVLLVIT